MKRERGDEMGKKHRTIGAAVLFFLALAFRGGVKAKTYF